MPGTSSAALAYIRRWLARPGVDPVSDAELVRQFVIRRDQAAFGGLVNRHGPMVLGVARRVLGDHHAAEDVFQATFLVLARQAHRLRRPAAVAAWLHHTARHLALTARRTRGRRVRAESAVTVRPGGDTLDTVSSRELIGILDEELQRLPEVFRLPLVLCCLEGLSQEEAARALGWSAGSVKGRLERGRQRLHDLLSRRGLTFAVAAGIPLLAEHAAVGAALRQGTMQCVFAGGQATAAAAALVAAARRPIPIVVWLLAFNGALIATAVVVYSVLSAQEPQAAQQTVSEAVADENTGEELPPGAAARFGSSRLRIGTGAAVALAPDGGSIVTVSPGGIVRRFDAGTGRLLERRLLSDRADVNPDGAVGVQLSDDGRTVAINERDGQDGRGARVTVRDVATGTVVWKRSLFLGGLYSRYALSPSGALVAFADSVGPEIGLEQGLYVCDLSSGRVREIGRVDVSVQDVRVSADDRRVYVSQQPLDRSKGAMISSYACFDVSAGKRLWELPAPGGGAFVLSPDGLTLVASARVSDPKVAFRIIDTNPNTGKAIETLRAADRELRDSNFVIARDNRTALIARPDALVALDIRTGETRVRATPSAPFAAVSGPRLGVLAADGRSLITNTGHVQRWDLPAGRPLFGVPPADGLRWGVTGLAFSADGATLVGTTGGETARWDVATGRRLDYIEGGTGYQLVATADGFRAARLAVPDSTGVALYDPVAGKPTWGHLFAFKDCGQFNAFALTADGKKILAALRTGGDPDGIRVTAVAVGAGRPPVDLELPEPGAAPIAPFSPCGRWAVVGGTVYDLGTGARRFVPEGLNGERLRPESDKNSLRSVWFSGDGCWLAGPLPATPGAEADSLGVWDVVGRNLVVQLWGMKFVRQVAFAPDGRTLALVDGRGIRIHALPTGKRLADYPSADVYCESTAFKHPAETLVFAPDGRTLATGHRDGSVVLWKVPR